MGNSHFCVLVEGPPWGDAHFCGQWLLAAAKAQTLWTEVLEDLEFAKQVEQRARPLSTGLRDRSHANADQAARPLHYIYLDLLAEDGEAFAMMVSMGPCIDAGQHGPSVSL
jgi:hypothetical protein